MLITVMVIIGPGMTPYTYSEQNLSQKNLAPRVASLEKLGIFVEVKVLVPPAEAKR